MTTRFKRHMWKVALFLALLAPAAAYADSVICNDCSPVAITELELVRGGFLGGDGLEVTFGIERAVYIDGILQATSSLNFPLSGSDSVMSVSNQQLSNMTIMRQSGRGNDIALTGGQNGLFTFIQNTLDLTAIKNVTQINATVNVLDAYRNMNLRSLINEQLINAMK